jgi:hypothetical protein
LRELLYLHSKCSGSCSNYFRNLIQLHLCLDYINRAGPSTFKM